MSDFNTEKKKISRFVQRCDRFYKKQTARNKRRDFYPELTSDGRFVKNEAGIVQAVRIFPDRQLYLDFSAPAFYSERKSDIEKERI